MSEERAYWDHAKRMERIGSQATLPDPEQTGVDSTSPDPVTDFPFNTACQNSCYPALCLCRFQGQIKKPASKRKPRSTPDRTPNQDEEAAYWDHAKRMERIGSHANLSSIDDISSVSSNSFSPVFGADSFPCPSDLVPLTQSTEKKRALNGTKRGTDVGVGTEEMMGFPTAEGRVWDIPGKKTTGMSLGKDGVSVFQGGQSQTRILRTRGHLVLLERGPRVSILFTASDKAVPNWLRSRLPHP